MCGAFIKLRFQETVRRFARANEGNIAVIFTIALIPLISFIGAAIDYSRANNARSSMQAALDSTALMLSKDLSSGVITTAQIATQAQADFNALYTNPDAQAVSVTATYTADAGSMGSTVQVNGSAYINTDFMKLAGFPTIPFSSTSTTAWGNVKMRVALALDNTGSMADDGKIAALRTAASNLVDQLSALAKNPGDVYISVVPFAKVVNVGASNSGATWIDWTDWLNPPTAATEQRHLPGDTSQAIGMPSDRAELSIHEQQQRFHLHQQPRERQLQPFRRFRRAAPIQGYICPSVDANSHTLYNGCWDSEPTATHGSCSAPARRAAARPAQAGVTCTGSGSSKSCTGNTYVHNWTQPGPNDSTHNLNQPRVTAPVGYVNNMWTTTTSTPTVQNNWTQASTNPISTWTGCVTDRTQDYDTTGDAPTSNIAATLFPANQYYENSTAYCNPNSSTPLEPIMPMTYNWSSLKTNIAAMQPTGGTDQAIGLAWAWQTLLQTGPVPAPAEDPVQLHLQPGDHPAVGRPEYRRPLAGERQRKHAKQWFDRCPAAAAVQQSSKRQGCQRHADVHDLHDPGRHQHAGGSDLGNPSILRQLQWAPGYQQVFPADQRQPDRHHVQHDRHCAQRAARREIAASTLDKKKPGRNGRAFDSQ